VLTVDLTRDGDDTAFGGSPTVQADGTKPFSATSALASPSHRESPNKRSRQQALSNESATVRPSALERQSSNTTIPFPPRPGGQYAAGDTAQANKMQGGAGEPVKTERKTQSLETPAVARRFPHGSEYPSFVCATNVPLTLIIECADYYPWAGNHPEDQLYEQTVKSGFPNKPLIANETNTARPSLWNHLKNKQGLSTLSQLFVTVLEKRQIAGRLTAPSTFKPPPRVSLNQTRREAWLGDLANSAVQLRRLSRTIPFGMNGKTLLEACLNKNIPIARAVWLAKCVGANELRAYKRKGAGSSTGISGELKWIREWTTGVEQFVEGTLNLCGEANWMAKIHYAIRLSAYLYNEQLLDQEHYLDWVLSSFDSSPPEKLPFWLLLVQTYWKHLVATRKRGRKLAEHIFARMESISVDDGADILSQVLRRLQQLATTLAVAHRGCMILPKLWAKYKHLLQSTFGTMDTTPLESAVENLTNRNDRLTPDSHAAKSLDTVQGRIFKELDEARFHDPIEKLFERCVEISADLPQVSQLVVKWTTSIYRDGIHRVYIGTRLLRKCYLRGVDVDNLLLDFVSDSAPTHGVDFSLVFKLVAELVRSEHFSVTRFFQSLIATGALSAIPQGFEIFPTPSKPIQPYERLALLAASIPTQNLPYHVTALRALLLRDAGPAMSKEPRIIQEVTDVIQMQMSNSQEPLDLPLAPSELTPAVKFAVSHWVRTYVQSRLNAMGKELETDAANPTVTLQFLVARHVLELMEDYSILADIIGMTIPVGDTETLTSVADTLHMHYKSFAAIGALKPLYGTLLDRYRIFRGQEQLDKPFVSAIRDLSVTLGLNMPIIQQLNADLARCNQRDAIAMCSPASDNATDILQIDIDTDDEIERILSSGTTMDEQIMSRVFKRIAARTEKNNPEQRVRVGNWLNRLKSFDYITFDRIMAEWMTTLLSFSRPLGLQLLPTLIGCGCINVAAFAQCAERGRVDKDRVLCCQLDLDVLEVVFSEHRAPSITSIPDAYRYRLETRKYANQYSKDILVRLQRAIASVATSSNEAIATRLLSFLNNLNFVQFLKRQALDKEIPLSECLGLDSEEKPAKVSSVAARIVDGLTDPYGQLGKLSDILCSGLSLNLIGLFQNSRSDHIPQLLKIADELSLPFCQLQLRLLLSNPGSVNSPNQELASKLFEAIRTAADNDQCVWPELVKNLDSRITQKVCEHAESLVLSAASQLKQTTEQSVPCSTVRKLLSIVDHTCVRPTMQSFHQIALVLTEKMKIVMEALAQPDIDPIGQQPGASNTTTSDVQHICLWIQALLHLAILHKPACPPQSKPLHELVPFISILVLLLNHTKLQSSPETLEYIFDVAAYFSDDLSDDQRNHLGKAEFQKTSDPRISFLFGSSQSPDAWLGLVTSNSNPLLPLAPSASAGAPQPVPPRPGPPQMSRQGSMHQPMRPGTPMQQQRISQAAQPAKTFNPPVPYQLKRWEILPDQGGSANANAQHSSGPANDTSISLTLFGARKVG
jgi:mediator of RNA polymerase II transcription subunit 12, fungi type